MSIFVTVKKETAQHGLLAVRKDTHKHSLLICFVLYLPTYI